MKFDAAKIVQELNAKFDAAAAVRKLNAKFDAAPTPLYAITTRLAQHDVQRAREQVPYDEDAPAALVNHAILAALRAEALVVARRGLDDPEVGMWWTEVYTAHDDAGARIRYRYNPKTNRVEWDEETKEMNFRMTPDRRKAVRAIEEAATEWFQRQALPPGQMRQMRTQHSTSGLEKIDTIMASLERVGAGNVSQRWKNGISSFVSNDERISKFKPDDYEVRKGTKATAISFSDEHHYLGGVGQWTCGAFLCHKRSGKLVGIATFSNVARNAKYGGLGGHEMASLSRLVLLTEVPGNAETWFLSRAMRIVQQVYQGPDRPTPSVLKLLVSHSDPVPRIGLDGKALMPGHIGNIYQSANATYLRPSAPVYEYTTIGKPPFSFKLDGVPSGVVLPTRSLSKIRSIWKPKPEAGAWTALETLLKYVSDDSLRRRHGESNAAWEKRLVPSRGQKAWLRWVNRVLNNKAWFEKTRHPGKLTYVWTYPGVTGYGRRALNAKRQKLIEDVVEKIPAKNRDAIPWQDVLRLVHSFGGETQIKYPKKARQAYLSLGRYYTRAWSKGEVAHATLFAQGLLLIWRRFLSAEERSALTPPPSLQWTCPIPTRQAGAANRDGRAFSLDDLLHRSICRIG
jgi:hypothetical protein